MAQLHADVVLNDRYRVGALLAMGGMAEVWVAQDLLLERTVAVKVLRAGIASDLEAADRLRAEARLAAMISSERVVRVHDVGEVVDADGRRSPYLVMELVQGDTLRDLMLRGPMAPEQVRRFVTQVAQALAEAHALGVIHRDIKPANILVTPSGDTKVTDFGISSSAGSASLTATGLVMGTARYLSPEQVSGHRAAAASDVYSLGVVAHEALRGQAMFSADGDIEAALAHVQQQPPALPAAVPADLAALVFQMLAKDPAERPTAAQIASGSPSLPARTRALPTALSATAAPVAARPTNPTRSVPLVVAPAPRRPRAFAAAGLTGVLLLFGAAATAWGSMELSEPRVDSSSVTPAATASGAPHPSRSAASTVTSPVTSAVTTVARTTTTHRVTAPHRPPAAHPAAKPKKTRKHGKPHDD